MHRMLFFPVLLPLVALIVVAALFAAGPQPPPSACDFDGFDVNAQLAEVSRPGTGYYGCAAGRKCFPMTLAPGDTVVIARAEGDWTCGYLTGRKGAAQGWVRSQDLRTVQADANPTRNAWAGTWVQDKNRITIDASKNPGTLALDGEAYWRGGRDNVHEGSISGEVTPAGNRAHYDEGSPESCSVDLALLGNYLLTSDNNKCGGLNVRFWGVWRRGSK